MDTQVISEVWLGSNSPGSGCLFTVVCECKGVQLLGCGFVEGSLWQGTLSCCRLPISMACGCLEW